MKKVHAVVRYALIALVAFLTLFVIRINLLLHTSNQAVVEKKADIISQLNYLENELKAKNLGERMQDLFPEGFVFVNALYGLSWCELAINSNPSDQFIKDKALQEALYAYQTLDSQEAKWTFDKEMDPEYGIFYFGWKNYLLSKILRLDTNFAGHELYIKTFSQQCEHLKKALNESDSPYLQSYEGHAWPADMFVAMAALNAYNQVFKPGYNNEVRQWLDKVQQRLDPETKMVPHSVNSETGMPIQGSRGSSMSLVLRLLPDIDSVFAQKQFLLFKNRFSTKTLGLPTISEYPKGKKGSGDIDSGPVVFGVGTAATIMMIGVYANYGEAELSAKQYATINAFGFASRWSGQKNYLFGQLPMADAFISWGRASSLHNELVQVPSSFGILVHIISAISLLLCWVFIIPRKPHIRV
jgi:hypothetical protein